MRDEFKHEFNTDVQIFLLNCIISDQDIFARCRTIVRDEYFDDQLSPTVRFILRYADEFRTLPEPALIYAKTGQQLTPLSQRGIVEQREWFLKEIESFCRYRAMENVILDGVDLLRQGEAGEVERRIKEAMTISLTSDLGTNYFHDPAERLRRMIDRSSFMPTGWRVLDEKLFGGFLRGGLNVFCGSSGSGKSLMLQNLALNWVLAGLVVVYFTLELSEDSVALRMDSMLTGMSTKEIVRKIHDTALILGVKYKHYSDRLFVKKMPEGSTTTNDLRGFLKEFEIQTGLKPDAIIVDYLDMMYPNNSRVDPSDLWVKDKFVSEELRALHYETNTLGATASQLNRQAVEVAGSFNHSHIGGGISKINTADNVIAIYATDNMKERGDYQLILLKTRSSSSTGHHIKLRYDPDCMRITDGEVPDVEQARSMRDIGEEIRQKTKSSVTDGAAEPSQEFMDLIWNRRDDRG
jgi:archaellum biogenesis ATPase FlaH